ncbi:MAG: MFS transporter [Solirubrobacterales bacterium]
MRAIAAATLVARLPYGMGTIALIIFTHSVTGSYGAAGAVGGLYTFGFAVTGPFLGRLVDRRGPRAVIIAASSLCSLATLGVVILGSNGAGLVPIAIAAGVAGAATPPISGLLRRTWPSLVTRDQLPSAYLFDAILIEGVFIAGPLLTGLLTALISPAAPLLLSVASGAIGAVFFLRIPEVASIPPVHEEHHSRAGALASPTIRYLVITGLSVTFTFGALDVALPAFGTLHGNSALGGVFASATGVGSICGALLFSAAGSRLGNLRRGLLILVVVQPLLSLPLLLAPSPLVMIPLIILASSYAAPLNTLRSQMAEKSMPPGTGTETFSWLLLTLMLGISLGSLLGGPVVGVFGWRAGVLLGIGGSLLMLPFTLTRRSLMPRG